jgi:hypothetical protein
MEKASDPNCSPAFKPPPGQCFAQSLAKETEKKVGEIIEEPSYQEDRKNFA